MAASDRAHLDALERENERLRRSVKELSLLNDLAQEIGASHDSVAIMQTIVRRALKNIGAEQGVITLIEAQHDDPTHTLVRSASSAVQQEPFHLNDNLLGWMQLHKKPLRLNDPAQDQRFRNTRWHPAIRSMLCAPLLMRAQLMGVLVLYNKRAAPGFSEDDQRLLAIIAAQSAQIIENARLAEEEKALHDMREAIHLAQEIQTALLPTISPDIPGYAIAGTSRAAQMVGGDYFDYIPLDEGRLGLCVGDVSGKGLPASLLMANVQATLRGQAPWSKSADRCLAQVNDLLCQRIRKGTFVTLWYGMLDPPTHTVRYANAGHNRPLVRRADGSIEQLDTGNFVLGFLPDQTYQETVCNLAPGDTLLIYSDGLTEAMNAHREQFGEARLETLLQTHGDAPAATLLDHLLAAVQHHAGSAPQTDDITLLLVKRLTS